MTPEEQETRRLSPPPINEPWAHAIEDVCDRLATDPSQGLSAREARRRRSRWGPNRLGRRSGRSVRRILLDQFKSLVVIILAVASVLALAFGNLPEGIAILVVIAINGTIGFVSEWRAARSMESLRKIGSPTARIRRSGRQRQAPVESLAPGDVVLLEAGDVVPADLRLTEANKLRADESALTGESESVLKTALPVEAAAPLAERRSMLFKGTVVTTGSGESVITATGMRTELGRISELAEEVDEELTPLERRLEQLGRRLAWLVLAAVAAIAAVGIWTGRPTLLIIEASVALGVAAIPEGLPIVANLALARGMWLMSKYKALVNRLPAVETLGATGVILTDKTGTLTENRMTLRRVATPVGECEWASDSQRREEAGDTDDDQLMRRAVEIGVLCSNASLTDTDGDDRGDEAHGDPTEIALLRAGELLGLSREDLLDRKPETREEAFDPESMMMATFHRFESGCEVAVKGAPRAVLSACRTIAAGDGEQQQTMADKDRRAWLERAVAMGREGLRVLAVADKQTDSDGSDPYGDLRFLGLLGMYDPPRMSVKAPVAACAAAGIRVVMVTGDQPDTARAVAGEVGLVEKDQALVIHGRDLVDRDRVSDEDRRRWLESRIFARVSPGQKLDLVKLYQDEGRTVAMTGDGINDAPALKKADIGVAMGRRGSDAAREASDIVLKDDAFSSIVAAVEQGRVIFANIRRAVMFMLCTNVAEIIAVAAATLAGAPLPLLPLQILYLNFLTDALPGLALGVGKGDPNVMIHPPRRPDEAVLTRAHWLAVGGWGAMIAACVLASLAAALMWLDLDQARAVTVSFATLALAKLWFVLNLRRAGSELLDNSVVKNPWIWGSVAACLVLVVAAVYVPWLSGLLKTRALGPGEWALVLGLSALPVAVGQTIRAFQRAGAAS